MWFGLFTLIKIPDNANCKFLSCWKQDYFKRTKGIPLFLQLKNIFWLLVLVSIESYSHMFFLAKTNQEVCLLLFHAVRDFWPMSWQIMIYSLATWMRYYATFMSWNRTKQFMLHSCSSSKKMSNWFCSRVSVSLLCISFKYLRNYVWCIWY